MTRFRATAPSATARAPEAPPLHRYDEREADSQRDPFCPMFALAVDPPPEPDHDVAAWQEPLDSLQLGGTILGDASAARAARVGADGARAMLTDASGFGWIVRPGDRVGRAERIGGTQVYWRVDRIRDGQVVLRLGNDARYAATRTRTMTFVAAPPRRGISL